MSKIDWIKRFEPINETKLKEAALETAAWIEQYGHVEDKKEKWDVLPGEPDPVNTILLKDTSLYGGAAGVALLYLRIYTATKDEQWLEKAKYGLDYIISNYKGVDDFQNLDSVNPAIDVGFFNSSAGGAYVASLYYDITKDETYNEFAKQVAKDCIAAAHVEGDELDWYGFYGIIGSGSLILYLVDAYERFKDAEILEAIKKAARYVYNQKEEAPIGGYRWYAMPTDTFPTIKKAGGYFPGFEYGAAGTGFILASVYEHTKQEDLLDAAKKAAEYVMNIADYSADGEVALVRYNDPYFPDLYYLGACQGPVGTSRLFFKLYQLTGEEKYKDFVIKLTNGILAAGAPAKHSEGYWRTNCYCCGAAGMLEHFVNVHKFTGDAKYLDAAYESAEVIIGESTYQNKLRNWYTAWNRHEPHTSQAYIGLYHGSGGCASSLLMLAQYISNGEPLQPYLEDAYKVLY